MNEQKIYWSNGQLQFQRFYINGKIEGESKWWYEDGQLRSSNFFRDSKLDGESKGWHKNGQLEWCRFYRNNKLEGESKWFYENGRLRRRYFYLNDKLEGECKGLDKNFQLYEYWINNEPFDRAFSVWKKVHLIKLKRNIIRKVYNSKYSKILNEQLISDLSCIIIQYL